MNKISKNIKRLRTAQNLSQEELAEKLYVSRQAISSWENNRTQPDIEMIGKLSEVFNVSVEELIYGEKRKTEIDNENTPHINKNMIIVFSVIGSVFVALSLIFFLFLGWESFGMITKAVVSFLPLFAGQSIAIFTYYKKFDKIAWRESSAILWCIGVISTLALINSIFNIYISDYIFIVIVCLIILPIIYIFDVVSPLIPYFALSLSFNTVVSYNVLNQLMICFLSTFFVGAGVLYTTIKRCKDNSPRREFGIVVTLLAIVGLLFIYAFCTDDFPMYSSGFVIFTAFFTGLIAYGKDGKKAINIIGSLGLVTSIIFLTFAEEAFVVDSYSSVFTVPIKFSLIAVNIFKWLLSTGFITAGFLSFGEEFRKNKTKLFKCIVGVAATILAFIFLDDIEYTAIVLAIAISVLYMLSGTKENNFFDFNLGLISLLVCIFRIIILLNGDILLLAFIFLISGISLLVTNLALLKKAQKEKQATLSITGGENNVQK